MLFDMIGTIYTISSAIAEQINLVVRNKEQCKELYDQVKIVIEIIKRLERVTNREQYNPALVELKKCLEKCLKFVKHFSKKKSLLNQVENFLKQKKYQLYFETLIKQLSSTVLSLDLALNAQQLVNREKDNTIQEEHYEKITKIINHMLKLQQEENQKLRDILNQYKAHSEQHKSKWLTEASTMTETTTEKTRCCFMNCLLD